MKCPSCGTELEGVHLHVTFVREGKVTDYEFELYGEEVILVSGVECPYCHETIDPKTVDKDELEELVSQALEDASLGDNWSWKNNHCR